MANSRDGEETEEQAEHRGRNCTPIRFATSGGGDEKLYTEIASGRRARTRRAASSSSIPSAKRTTA